MMRDMLVAGGVPGGLYGEAIAIYTQLLQVSGDLRAAVAAPPAGTKQSGNVFRVGVFLDFVWLTTRTRTMHPRGAYVRGARRNRPT